MCKAFEDMRLEGIEQGIEQGIDLMCTLSLRLARDGRVEDIVRASADAVYRNELLLSYGIFSE